MILVLDTNVPYGNACDIAVKGDEVAFSPDPHGGPECLWFRFRIMGGRAKGKVRLVLRNARNILGYSSKVRMRPVVRYEGGDWERMDVGAIERLPDGRAEISWAMDAPKTFADIAYCYPYGMPEVDALIKETGSHWKADVIGVSQKARQIVRLSNGYGEEDSSRPGLYLIARQHSAEVTGSWVLDGFLRHIATLGDDAPLVWAVPLSNIDGIEQGDYGKDNFPYDLNRAWGNPPMRHETLVIQRDAQEWKKRCGKAAGIDFHSPGSAEDEGTYIYQPDPKKFPDFHMESKGWIEAMAKALGADYAADKFGRVADYRSRWETPWFRDFAIGRMKIFAFSIETPYAHAGNHVLTREDYREIGRRMASASVEIIGK